MASIDDEHDQPLAALLSEARPSPSLAWAGELERSLFPARRPWRERRLVLGASLASALAAVLLVVSLVGGGPLAPHGGTPATAGQHCTTVYVTKVAPVGQVVRRADGTVTVETTQRPVTRAQQRCH